eukprot:scaffold6046_cov158-Skeletonema_menzelii.AAC.15
MIQITEIFNQPTQAMFLGVARGAGGARPVGLRSMQPSKSQKFGLASGIEDVMWRSIVLLG